MGNLSPPDLVVCIKQFWGVIGMVLPKGGCPEMGLVAPPLICKKGKKYSEVRKCRVILLSISSTFVGVAQPCYEARC